MSFAAFIRQSVNSWLCILLISSMAFWTILYYFTHKAQAIADAQGDGVAGVLAEYQ